MTALDPYRTLGLEPGATPAEVKRAYRRLAKQYHPDSAGERTLPRFLAIQAAYEALGGAAGAPRPGAARPAGPGQPGPVRPAWQADPERSRATREAYRARTRRASAGGEATGTAGAGRAASGGARPSGEGATPGGRSGGRSGGRESRRPKATIGSTSYDGADREPFDPAWEGGDWYGAGSGTYWTLNPKEYADPRKHGPEYQARSRRSRTAGGRPDPVGDRPVSGTPEPAPERAPDRAPDSSRRSESSAQRPSSRPTAATSPSARGVPTVPGRMLLAFVGWIPLAVGLSAASTSLPACGGAATLCGDPLAGGGIWLVHLAIVAILLAVPRLAWITASGSLAFLAAGLLGAPALLALGGARTPEGTSAALSVVLVVAWLAGVGFALSGRLALPPWRPARVR